ncbi:MAG TPA: M1 family metallopeptidase [Nocardioidaceae bacterium]|nr:M1 family metallopeptidase [Nocardioidaceae bacterium]
MLRSVAPLIAAALVLPLAGPARAAPYDDGLSSPVEDSYYPAKGDPGIDTLHYDLELTWLRRARVLRGDARITFRAVTDDNSFPLDLSPAMRVRRVEVGGNRVPYTHTGKNLVVDMPVAEDSRYTTRVVYRGTPEPAAGPASRSDIARLGMRVTKDGQLWTMQEPFGAFTWYPANDQPSDKALYDVRIDAPGDWVGVSTGEMTKRRKAGSRTITEWTNEHPMSSYLMTMALGPYRLRKQTGPRGLPLTYWVPRDRPHLVTPLLRTPSALRWLKSRLGPYPFDRAGVVVTPSDSAMETQTMITFGAKNYRYGTRDVRQTMVHELAHSWYGNSVTPSDWRDLWMNEGMATYLDTRWAVDQGWSTWRRSQRYWKWDDPWLRRTYGPPGAYKRGEFGSSNVYDCTALMWDRLRLRLGNAEFDRLVRQWPQQHRDTNQSRESYVDWAEAFTGENLGRFFEKWLTSRKSPTRKR